MTIKIHELRALTARAEQEERLAQLRWVIGLARKWAESYVAPSEVDAAARAYDAERCRLNKEWHGGSCPPMSEENLRNIKPMIEAALKAAAVWRKEHDPKPALRRWRHLKRGTEYVEITRAKAQCATGPIYEGDVCVVYRGDAGEDHIRKDTEFEDGRFEEITA
jgi:hypothetical protein